jgi:tetratricopeptide (TPR) repeat protein
MPQDKNTDEVKPYPNRIRQCIKQRGYTIQEVAEEISIPRRTLTDYISGNVPTPRHWLEKIAQVIGCGIEELLIQPSPLPETPATPAVATTQQRSPVQLLTKEQKQLLKSLLAIDEDILTQELPSDEAALSRHDILQIIFGLARPGHPFPLTTPQHIETSSRTINEDALTFFESTMSVQWELYHTGGAIRVINGIGTLVKEIDRLAQSAQGSIWQKRALTLLTMSYQLQSCILRDTMNYTQAHIAYQKAFHVAQELDDPELLSSALAREGVTLIQQDKPKQAIIYLDGALNTIEEYNFPKLKGNILQALSEANAKAQRPQDCWDNAGQAENITDQPIQERSLIRFNKTSLRAQKGINALLLGNHQEAITLLDRSLTTYDPALIRGRARIIAQKAEAYYGLGAINECIMNAKEALTLARSAGSNKTIDRVRNLYSILEQSPWGKDQSIAQLGDMLKPEDVEK